MPLINVKLTSPMPSKEDQDKVAKEITEIFVRNLGKTKQRTIITFEEVGASDFYFGGQSVESMRSKK
ncbi:MAG: 4-oxalocrotonate tautomerase family protein [Campylobacter sp.]|nr:4-oxalocrotonate tautomerase family protein [Campylobacter sp.]